MCEQEHIIKRLRGCIWNGFVRRGVNCLREKVYNFGFSLLGFKEKEGLIKDSNFLFIPLSEI